MDYCDPAGCNICPITHLAGNSFSGTIKTMAISRGIFIAPFIRLALLFRALKKHDTSEKSGNIKGLFSGILEVIRIGGKMKKPTVKLTGQDGNAFMILGTVCNALKKAGYPKEKLEEYLKEAKSGDYDNLLCATMKWVDVK